MAKFDIDLLLGIKKSFQMRSLDDYANSIDDLNLRERVLSLFQPYEDTASHIKSTLGLPLDTPHPSLFFSEENNEVSTAYDRIIIGENFVLQCLNTNVPSFNSVAPEYEDDLNVEELAPIITMLWTYSHEYHHLLRKHTELKDRLKELEGDKFDEQITDYALERDADLCAIGVVYRYLRYLHKGLMPDLMIRKLTIFLIFWTLRPDSKENHGDRHLSMGVRLMDLIESLAIFLETPLPGEIPDISGEKEETKVKLITLADFLGKCEKVYMQNYNKNQEDKGLVGLIENGEMGTQAKLMAAIIRWDSIRSLVTEVSGTKA